jgi:hypothetical protein
MATAACGSPHDSGAHSMSRVKITVRHVPEAAKERRFRMHGLGHIGFGKDIDVARADLLSKMSFDLRRQTEDAARDFVEVKP